MANKLIEFNNVSFTYTESKTPAIKDLTFDVKENEWFTILGHNGSGKSTITRLINGLLLPNDRENSHILVDGMELNEKNIWNVRDKVGIVFQNPDNQFVGATVGDDIAFGLENRGIDRSKMKIIVAETVKEVGMQDYIDSEPSNLSGGQKQRVAIAGILAVRPKILIMDEATSMLDPKGRNDIISLVKRMKEKENLTVISITHNIDEAMIADHVLLLDDGKKIMQGTPDKVFEDADLIKRIGLEEPFIINLKRRLQEQGIELSKNSYSQEDLVKELCQLNSKM